MTRKKKQRKKTRKNKLQLKKIKQKFFEKVGCLTIFLVIFSIVIGLFTYQWLEYRNQQRELEILEEQKLQHQREFIETLVPIAQKLQRQYGVLASVSIAQAILESEYGESELASVYYNLYGVKTDEEDEDGVDLVTREFTDGEWVEIVDRFKVYPSWEASMTAHAELIYHGTSWDSDYYLDVLKGKNYKAQTKGLQSSGYATDPTYSDKLIQMIELWDLSKYDLPIESIGREIPVTQTEETTHDVIEEDEVVPEGTIIYEESNQQETE